ncbi:MAG: hypothetical protein IPN71_12315 [Fibrobacteres bacterium]|nr:hypothetical protein [Fibrobacterota bacterium]
MGPDKFQVKAILQNVFGQAQPGDEVTYNLVQGFSATGPLYELLFCQPARFSHDD